MPVYCTEYSPLGRFSMVTDFTLFSLNIILSLSRTVVSFVLFVGFSSIFPVVVESG